MRVGTILVSMAAAALVASCGEGALTNEDRYPEGEFVRDPETKVLVPVEDGRLEVDTSKEPPTKVVVPARTFGNEDGA